MHLQPLAASFPGAVRSFAKTRLARWRVENLAANPQELWRVRPRNVQAYALQAYALGDAPALRLGFLSQASTVKLANPGWLFCTPGLNAGSTQLAQILTPRVFSWLNLIIHAPSRRAVLKLKYKGKSFRWHRRKKSLLLRFGHSHFVFRTPLPWIKSRKHGRMKIIFWGTNAWYLKRFLQLTVRWRPMNIYHGRGLRLTKQKVPRKAGKVSAYR